MRPFEYRRMTPDARVYVAGHRGLAGSAICRRLKSAGYVDVVTRPHQALDLTRQSEVERFFEETRPEFVILAAAKVGGILANATYRADFIRDNLLIQTNVLSAAHRHGVQRLLFLGSNCIYPRDCPQPIQETSLLTGALEETNLPYAVAKISGIVFCDALNQQHGTRYLSVMPSNLYGPGDNFDLETSHVLPALIRKFYEATAQGDAQVTIWGTGTPRREFLYVDDLADACVFLLEHTDTIELLNIGSGRDISVLELARLIADVVGFEGRIDHDLGKPDGTPQKHLDLSRLSHLGWAAETSLRDGIAKLYTWYSESRKG